MALSKYAEYNLDKLERLLAPACKSDNARGLALILCDRYGCIENVFAADGAELSLLVGESVAVYLKVLGAVTSRRYCTEFELGKPHTRAEIADYLKALMLTESVECVYVLLLDDKDAVTGCNLISRGTVNSSDVIPRKILEAAIHGGSRRVIIAHNHPRGVPRASEEDIRLTDSVSYVLGLVGIELEYHIIVAGIECDLIENESPDAPSADDYETASQDSSVMS